MKTEPALQIEQRHRDAAADYVRDNQQPKLEQQVRAGKSYVGLAQAFAAFERDHCRPATDEALREALEPFARIGEMLNFAFAPAFFPDSARLNFKDDWKDNGEDVAVMAGDFRRAYAALAAMEGR